MHLAPEEVYSSSNRRTNAQLGAPCGRLRDLAQGSVMAPRVYRVLQEDALFKAELCEARRGREEMAFQLNIRVS